MDTKIAFIDPKAALAALEATKKPVVDVEVVDDLGPSGPHDDDIVELPTLGFVPDLTPLIPPTPHYTAVLDELWPEFDDPEERTVARLESLLGETAVEAQKVLNLKTQIWEDLASYKIDDATQARFDKEFLAYLKRLNDYRRDLAALDDDSTDTEAVYVGLVKRREGTGPVPDAIMHLYFVKQLGILEDHAHDMGEGFVARVLVALDALDEAIEETAQQVKDAADKKTETIRDMIDAAGDGAAQRWRRAWLWAGGITLGTLVVGGAVAAVVLHAGKDAE